MATAVGRVTLYAPPRPADQVVLFLSGDGGWNLGVVAMAERLRSQGALVAGIDVRAFMKRLEATAPCAYPAGDLEELSRAVQLHQKLPAYKRPILVGYSSGATLAYAALAAAPAETFAGGVSLGFCPDLALHRRPCALRGLSARPRRDGKGVDLEVAPQLAVPWMVLQGDVDQVCAPEGTRRFVAQIPSARLFWLPKVGHGFGVTARWEPQFIEAYRQVAVAAAAAEAAASVPARSAPAVADLPLQEVPVPTGGDLFAVLLTGDGGWADIDKSIAGSLAAAGVPVVGWNSLKYYWKARTPEEASRDLDRIVRHYGEAWGRPRVVLVGFSFGADVLPFLVNRLPASTRGRVAEVALVGLSRAAAFEFHVTDWLGGGDEGPPTVPEVERLDVPVACLHGTDETDSACRSARGPRIHGIELPGGHHMGGQYDRVAEAILKLAASR